MYWWNYRKLAEDLRDDRVDERERFKYFLATFIGWNMAVLLWAYSPAPFLIRLPGVVVVAIYVLIAIIGIAACYRANQRGDNVDFIARMICLGLPVGVQCGSLWAMFVLTAGVIVSAPAAALGPVSFVCAIPGEAWNRWTDHFADFGGLLLNIFYFQTIYAHIAFAAKAKGAEDSEDVKQTYCSLEHLILGMLSGNVIVVAILLLAGAWVPSFSDHPFAWEFFPLLGIVLWTLLFAFVLSRYRRRSVEHA